MYSNMYGRSTNIRVSKLRKNIGSTADKLAVEALGPLVCMLKRLKNGSKMAKRGQILEWPNFHKLENKRKICRVGPRPTKMHVKYSPTYDQV